MAICVKEDNMHTYLLIYVKNSPGKKHNKLVTLVASQSKSPSYKPFLFPLNFMPCVYFLKYIKFKLKNTNKGTVTQFK